MDELPPPGQAEALQAVRRCSIDPEQLPVFPYEFTLPIRLVCPTGGRVFDYAEMLPLDERATLNRMREGVAATLSDAGATTVVKLAQHERYLRRLPADTGEFVVYNWGGVPHMDTAFERFHLLGNMAWMRLDLATAAASTGSYTEAIQHYGQAAGLWLQCAACGFRPGEVTWSTSQPLMDKKYATAMHRFALALAHLATVEKLLDKVPATGSEAQRKFRILLNAVVAHAAQRWAAVVKEMDAAAVEPLVSYARLMRLATEALNFALAASSILHHDRTTPRCEKAGSNPHGVALRLLRTARARLTRATALPLLAGGSGGASTQGILDVLKQLAKDKGRDSAGPPTVTLRPRLADQDAYRTQLLTFTSTLSERIFQAFNALEGDVLDTHKVEEASADVVEMYTAPGIAKLMAAFQPEPIPLDPPLTLTPAPSAAGSGGGGSGNPSATGATVGGEAGDGASEGTGESVGPRGSLPPDQWTADQRVARQLLDRSVELRVAAGSLIPAVHRTMVKDRERVMRHLIQTNVSVLAVIATLRQETIPYMEDVLAQR